MTGGLGPSGLTNCCLSVVLLLDEVDYPEKSCRLCNNKWAFFGGKKYAFASCFRTLAVILVSDSFLRGCKASSYLRTHIPEVAYALTIPVSPCFFPGSFLG